MKFGILPPYRAGVTADPLWMVTFAQHAEAIGFESIYVAEHVVVPPGYADAPSLLVDGPHAVAGGLPATGPTRAVDVPRGGHASGSCWPRVSWYCRSTTQCRWRSGPRSTFVRRTGPARHRAGVDARGGRGLRHRLRHPRREGRRDDRGHACAVDRGRAHAFGRLLLVRTGDLTTEAGADRWCADPHRWSFEGRGATSGSDGRRLPAARPGRRRAGAEARHRARDRG